jgi:sugar/nucleoside kinase (ribokinase family)
MTIDSTSPNHIEALSLCSISSSSPKAIEEACIILAGLGPKKAVVIRAGALGACYALSSSPQSVHWVPAYWTESEIDQVVDVTGAGNGFLGGLCAGLDEGRDVIDGESDT